MSSDVTGPSSGEQRADETDARAEELAVQTAVKALDLATQLAETLGKISERLETYAVYGKRSRRIIAALAVSFTLDIILTVIVTILSASALHHSTAVHQSQLAACAIGNQTRRGDVELWGYVLKLSAKSPNSNQAQLRMFKVFVDKTFAPVDCAKLYR
jgi:hypothetical protein